MVKLDEAEAIISGTIGSVSVLGGLSVIATSALFKKFRSHSRTLICMLSFCNIMQGIFFVSGLCNWFTSSNRNCRFYTIWGIVACCSEFIMITCIAFSVYRMLISTPHIPSAKVIMMWQPPVFAAISLGYPSLALFISWEVLPDSIKTAPDRNETVWCFIPYKYVGARIITVYIPLVVCWALTIFFAYRSKRILWKLEQVVRTTTQSRKRSSKSHRHGTFDSFGTGERKDSNFSNLSKKISSSHGPSTGNSEKYSKKSTSAEANKDSSLKNGAVTERVSFLGNLVSNGSETKEASQRQDKRSTQFSQRSKSKLEQEVQDLQDLQRRLLLIPMLFVLCRFPGFIYRVAEIVWYIMGHHSELPENWEILSIIVAVGDPLQGILTGYIFVFSFREVREEWKKLFCGCFNKNLHRMLFPQPGNPLTANADEDADTNFDCYLAISESDESEPSSMSQSFEEVAAANAEMGDFAEH